MITKTIEIKTQVWNNKLLRRQDWVITTYRVLGIPVYTIRREVAI